MYRTPHRVTGLLRLPKLLTAFLKWCRISSINSIEPVGLASSERGHHDRLQESGGHAFTSGAM